MVSSSRLLPLATLGLLLPISACVTTPRTTALNNSNLYRYCDPYAISSGAYGRCYNGISRFDYLGYGGYYGSYGYPQTYGTVAPLYGAYSFNRGRGGFGSFHFDDGYFFASPYSHRHPDFGFVSVGHWSPHIADHFGQPVGYGNYSGLHGENRLHPGGQPYTGDIHHGNTAGHSRSSHGGSHH